VLIAGGQDATGAHLTSAELYDPFAGKFTATGSMATGRWNPSATLLSDGSVLIVGGIGRNSYLTSAETYDPESRTFASAGSMATARAGQAAALLPNGTVLITGGRNETTYWLSAEIWTE
jgi:hypothetical protein